MRDGNNTTVIIGNGFDLNLGLETSYRDFISSDSFNQLVKANNSLCIYLKDQLDINKWIDVENELTVYSHDVYKDKNRRVFREEYKHLQESLINYLNDQDLSKIDEGSRGYNLFVNGLQQFENLVVLDFNYTESVNYIFDKNLLNYTVHKVHGSAKDGKIVFGVQDDARIRTGDIFLKKSTCLWNNILDINTILEESDTVICMGYSLGKTDHHYFRNFFRNRSFSSSNRDKKYISISYYKEDGMYQILEQLDVLTSRGINDLRKNNQFEMFDLAK